MELQEADNGCVSKIMIPVQFLGQSQFSDTESVN